jgi:cell division protein FtsX
MILMKLSLRPWKLAPWSQLFASVAVGFLLLAGGSLYWFQRGLEPVIDRLRHEQVVTAFLSADSDAKQVSDSIRLALGAHGESAAIESVDAAGFMSELQQHYPELTRELSDLGQEAGAIVPRFISIAGMLPENAKDSIRAVSGIESAESSRDRYRNVVGAFQALRWVGRVLAAGLAFSVLVGLIHLGRVNSFFQGEALSILRLWGASALALRAPSVISGALVGLFGGLLAGTAWLGGASALAEQLRELSPLLKALPDARPEIAVLFVVCGCLAGAASGLIAGMGTRVLR